MHLAILEVIVRAFILKPSHNHLAVLGKIVLRTIDLLESLSHLTVLGIKIILIAGGIFFPACLHNALSIEIVV